MDLVFLVEETSIKIALDILVPKLIGDQHSFEVYNFRSKQDLLKKLEQRLNVYSKLRHQWEFRIVVLVDEDRQNCIELKRKMIDTADKCGVGDITLNRIVVEELESWFFGRRMNLTDTG